MLSKKLLVLLLIAAPSLVPDVAWARDDDEEEEEEEEESSSSKKKKRASASSGGGAGEEDTAKIREIVRGFYAKAGVGGAIYPMTAYSGGAQVMSAGTLVGLAIGQDFVDREKQSMAWELGIWQGLHNGAGLVDYQLGYGCTDASGANVVECPYTQGDLRTYAATLNYELSFYPSRRVGIGLRAGVGGMLSPLFIESTYYNEEVLTELGADPGKHNSFHFLAFGGPTFEYYTKLSHFSVGVDVDVFYALGWDLGINASGALKYTF